jgi:hypothetical protein
MSEHFSGDGARTLLPMALLLRERPPLYLTVFWQTAGCRPAGAGGHFVGANSRPARTGESLRTEADGTTAGRNETWKAIPMMQINCSCK